jgi:glycosyltransferase involved in cell wall biosynthesis
LNLKGHGTRKAARPDRFTVGYLARICPDKGLHQLVAAFELFEDDGSLPEVHLRVAGYLGQSDRGYLETIRTRVRAWKRPERFEYVGEVSREQKIEFLQSLDALSLPTVYRESKGISTLEALANAVPVVVPAHGTFPELIAATGGGLLHEPRDPRSLAAALKRLIQNPQEAEQLGRSGQRAVHARYNASIMAQETRRMYDEVRRAFRP